MRLERQVTAPGNPRESVTRGSEVKARGHARRHFSQQGAGMGQQALNTLHWVCGDKEIGCLGKSSHYIC